MFYLSMIESQTFSVTIVFRFFIYFLYVLLDLNANIDTKGLETRSYICVDTWSRTRSRKLRLKKSFIFTTKTSAFVVSWSQRLDNFKCIDLPSLPSTNSVKIYNGNLRFYKPSRETSAPFHNIYSPGRLFQLKTLRLKLSIRVFSC